VCGLWAMRRELPSERHHSARLQRRATIRRRQRPGRRVGPPWLPARSARRLNTPHTERLACSRQTTFRWHVYEEAPCSSAPGRGLLHSLRLSRQTQLVAQTFPPTQLVAQAFPPTQLVAQAFPPNSAGGTGFPPQPSWWHRLSSLWETRAETARLQAPGRGAETARPQGAAFLCASLHARPPRLHWEPTLDKSVPKPTAPASFKTTRGFPS